LLSDTNRCAARVVAEERERERESAANLILKCPRRRQPSPFDRQSKRKRLCALHHSTPIGSCLVRDANRKHKEHHPQRDPGFAARILNLEIRAHCESASSLPNGRAQPHACRALASAQIPSPPGRNERVSEFHLRELFSGSGPGYVKTRSSRDGDRTNVFPNRPAAQKNSQLR